MASTFNYIQMEKRGRKEEEKEKKKSLTSKLVFRDNGEEMLCLDIYQNQHKLFFHTKPPDLYK